MFQSTCKLTPLPSGPEGREEATVIDGIPWHSLAMFTGGPGTDEKVVPRESLSLSLLILCREIRNLDLAFLPVSVCLPKDSVRFWLWWGDRNPTQVLHSPKKTHGPTQLISRCSVCYLDLFLAFFFFGKIESDKEIWQPAILDFPDPINAIKTLSTFSPFNTLLLLKIKS